MPTPNVGLASDVVTLTIPSLAADAFRAEVRREVDELEPMIEDESLIVAHRRIADAIGDGGDVMVTDKAEVLLDLLASTTRTLNLGLGEALDHRKPTSTIRHYLLTLELMAAVIDGHDWIAACYGDGDDDAQR